ncbi:MAG TPA: hypothetical protein IAA21_11165 [Candidatus Blautia faecigallinarum]|uniref:Uncharacterized protein n=1 Tax=Candidatus Blautia faecigallinarum TaxID=2838488 RepID=A0A9D2DU90_9FIRM|nr:hypothetical protein [Candidatus Blautia faecigallinarum]
MAVKYNELICKYYIAFGTCSESREAHYQGHCGKCGKYVPRPGTRHIRRKAAGCDNTAYTKKE